MPSNCGCATGPSLRYDVTIRNIKAKSSVTCTHCESTEINKKHILDKKHSDCTWYTYITPVCGYNEVRMTISNAEALVFLMGPGLSYEWGPLPFDADTDDCTAPLDISGSGSDVNCDFSSSSVSIVASGPTP